jgi:LuxR family transcriptional regulator of csgAB operon
MNPLQKTAISLSPKEIALLRQLVEGATLRLIANNLDISEAMVMAHLRTIFRKLGVEDRSQAVTWARQNGISEDAPSD